MKTELQYLTPAKEDIEEIVKFHLTRVGSPYARKVYAKIKKELERLAAFPLLGQIHPDPLLAAEGFRKLVLTETYVAIYKVFPDSVVIYRIVNGYTDYPKLLR